MVHEKLKTTFFGATPALGMNAITKLCEPLLPGISTGVLAVPVTALVCGSVVW